MIYTWWQRQRHHFTMLECHQYGWQCNKNCSSLPRPLVHMTHREYVHKVALFASLPTTRMKTPSINEAPSCLNNVLSNQTCVLKQHYHSWSRRGTSQKHLKCSKGKCEHDNQWTVCSQAICMFILPCPKTAAAPSKMEGRQEFVATVALNIGTGGNSS